MKPNTLYKLDIPETSEYVDQLEYYKKLTANGHVLCLGEISNAKGYFILIDSVGTFHLALPPEIFTECNGSDFGTLKPR